MKHKYVDDILESIAKVRAVKDEGEEKDLVIKLDMC